jgi:hypothetical protein
MAQAEETKQEDMRIEIIERISKLPNLQKQIEAMRSSPNFKDLGEALSPVTIATKMERDWPISKQVETIAKEEKKQLKERMRETGAELLAFVGGGSNKEPVEPAPEKAPDVAQPLPLTKAPFKLLPLASATVFPEPSSNFQ